MLAGPENNRPFSTYSEQLLGAPRISVQVDAFCRWPDQLARRLVQRGGMLTLGYRPAQIAQRLAADDPDYEYRQYGIIDGESNVFAHTGPKIGQ